MGTKIAKLIDLLIDGEWHGIEELQRSLSQPSHSIEQILAFLDKYQFAKVDTKNKRVKINKDFLVLLEQPST